MTETYCYHDKAMPLDDDGDDDDDIYIYSRIYNGNKYFQIDVAIKGIRN